MILILLLSISISHISQFVPSLFLFLVDFILRDLLLIVMVSVCFMKSSNFRVFLLTRILVKNNFTGSASNVIAIWQKIIFKSQ